jgi:GNAT superfamily N-acetyltransferase
METIRLANTNDVARCAELLGILLSQEREFNPDPVLQRKGLEMIIRNPDAGFVLVCEIDGIIQGMVLILFTISTVLGSKVAILEDMIVSPDFRGKGLGTRLVKQAIESSIDKGCGRITLLTDHDNSVAHRFYSKCGFTKSDMVAFRMLIGS